MRSYCHIKRYGNLELSSKINVVIVIIIIIIAFIIITVIIIFLQFEQLSV